MVFFLVLLMGLIGGFGLGVVSKGGFFAISAKRNPRTRAALEELRNTNTALIAAEKGLRSIANSPTGSADLVAQNTLDAVERARYNMKDDQ